MSLPKETMDILEALAPELKESEDERIRKALCEFISDTLGDELDGYDISKNEALAYLEKQKEQKPAEWSEEDERLLTKLMTFVDIECFDRECNGQDVINWLKSIRPQPQWKPSEEHLSALLAIFNDPNNIGSQTCQLALTDLYEQLKKLM